MALYKNWPEICKVGHRNKLLMLVLASVPIDEGDSVFAGLHLGFSQCFISKKTDGPFPLSVIRELALKASLAGGSDSGPEYPDSYGVLDGLSIPSILFEVSCVGRRSTDWPLFPLPREIALALKQGDTVEWKGQPLVVLENNRNDRFNEWSICCAPAECIALDL